MSLLRELLALHEQYGDSMTFKDLDLWQGVASKSNLESADVEVQYNYEGASYSDHPYGSTTAREHHGAAIGVSAVRLVKDANEYDEDGDKVVGVLKAGTDLTQESWWQDDWTEWLEDQIAEKVGSDDGHDGYDFNDYDRDR